MRMEFWIHVNLFQFIYSFWRKVLNVNLDSGVCVCLGVFFFSPLHSHPAFLKDAFWIKSFNDTMIDLPRPLMQCKANFHLPCWRGMERRGAGEGGRCFMVCAGSIMPALITKTLNS